MGRWKDSGTGQAYYDANDAGPDQIAAPAPVQQQQMPRIPGNDGVTGYGNGNNPRPGQPMPTIDPMPVTPMPNVPIGIGNGGDMPWREGDMSLMPGKDGMWDWSHGGNKGNGQLDLILKMIMEKFGAPSGMNTMPVQTPRQQTAPRSGGFMGGMKSLGGAIGGLFGR